MRTSGTRAPVVLTSAGQGGAGIVMGIADVASPAVEFDYAPVERHLAMIGVAPRKRR